MAEVHIAQHKGNAGKKKQIANCQKRVSMRCSIHKQGQIESGSRIKKTTRLKQQINYIKQ